MTRSWKMFHSKCVEVLALRDVVQYCRNSYVFSAQTVCLRCSYVVEHVSITLGTSCNCCVSCSQRRKYVLRSPMTWNMLHCTTLFIVAEGRGDSCTSVTPVTTVSPVDTYRLTKMGFIGHYSLVDDVSICYVPLKSIYETLRGYLYRCSVILEPHRFYRGWNFCCWSVLLPFLDTRSNTTWSWRGRSGIGRSAMVNCFLALSPDTSVQHN